MNLSPKKLSFVGKAGAVDVTPQTVQVSGLTDGVGFTLESTAPCFSVSQTGVGFQVSVNLTGTKPGRIGGSIVVHSPNGDDAVLPVEVEITD